MATRHMTEEEIQAYLDKGQSSLDQVFDSHLSQCGECRARVSEYRQLYGALAEEPNAVLSPGFPDTVIARVAAEDAKRVEQRRWNILYSTLGVLGLIAASAYFINWQPLIDSIRSALAPSLNRGSEALAELQSSAASADQNTLLLLLFVVVVIAIIAGADHLLFRGRHARYCL